MNEKRRTIIASAITVGALIVLLLFFHLVTKGNFLEPINIQSILTSMVYPSFIAWAFCFLFACGYIDMSVGGVVVLASFATTILGNQIGFVGAVLGGLVAGTLLVFINFNIFAFTKVPSWIAGISMALIYEALAVFIKMSDSLGPLINANLETEYRIFGKFPHALILLVLGAVAVYFLYNRTSVGLNIRAVGGNKEISEKLGINIIKTLLFVGLICGILIGIAAFLQQSYSGRTTVKTGLTSMFMLFQPLAIALLAQILQKWINIIIAVPICAFIIYSVFMVLTMVGTPVGTLQNTALGVFIIVFGIIGQRGVKGVVK
jgi:ribose transport system permease protein